MHTLMDMFRDSQMHEPQEEWKKGRGRKNKKTLKVNVSRFECQEI